MKRTYLLISCMSVALSVFAQDAYDAWKFAQQDLFGTARYVGMSGAFAALGGDPSAVKDNPASLGVFRKTDVSITLDVNIERTNTNWNSRDNYTARATRVSCGQANWVQTFNTLNTEQGLVSHSFMLGYHRLKNHDRELMSKAISQPVSFTDFLAEYSDGLTEADMAGGFDNVEIPWLTVMGYDAYIINPDSTNPGHWTSVLSPNEHVNSTFNLSERGWTDEVNVGWGANLSNKFYFGLSLDLRLMQYRKDMTYSETFEQGGGFDINTYYRASGVGFNAVGGFIYRPTNWLRLALSAQTPTIMNYRENYDAQIRQWGITTSSVTETTPQATRISYRLTNPWRLTAGLATTFSTRALLSFQYDYEAYHTMRYSANSGNASGWSNENDQIRSQLKDAHTFRAGAEFFITNSFAIRAGYAFKTWFNSAVPNRYLAVNTMRTDTEFGIIDMQHYIGAGLGFRNNWLIAEIAYQYRISKEKMAPFNNVDPFSLAATSHRIVFTFGIK